MKKTLFLLTLQLAEKTEMKYLKKNMFSHEGMCTVIISVCKNVSFC